MRSKVVAVLAGGLALLGAGCTGDTDDPPASSPSDAAPGENVGSGQAPSDIGEDGLTGTFECDDQTISINSNGVDVELVGTCLTVSINGDDGTVSIEDATAVTVNGSGNQVTVGSATTITVNGDDSHVTYSGDPTVTVNGADSTAEES